MIIIGRREKAAVKDVVTESREGQDDRQQRPPLPASTDGQHVEQEELEQGKRKPIATLGCAKPTKEQRWRCQQQQEDERRHYLHHKLLAGHTPKRLSRRPFKQPSANKEEAGQSEHEEHIVVTHLGIAQTEATDMRIDHKNHRESPHGINVFYALATHSDDKPHKLHLQHAQP